MAKAILTPYFKYRSSVAILGTSFFIFYFSDALGKYLLQSGSSFFRYSAFVKAFFEILILCYAIITLNRTKANVLFGIAILTVTFLVGQLFLSFRFYELNFFENFNTLFKYFFTLIFFLVAYDVLLFSVNSTVLLKVYKLIIGLNSIFIMIGFFLEVPVFRTYSGPWRFGYDGLILAQNEASFIFIFALTTVYYRRFYLKIKEWFFWIVLIPSLIVATKGVYLYVILLFLFHIFRKVSMKNIFTFGIFIVGAGYLLFSSLLNKIILNSYAVFMYMYDKGGIWFALLSGRDQYLWKKLEPLLFDCWSFPNFLFGGQDVVAHYLEMGIFDLFLFFGLVGAILYGYIFYQIFKFLQFPTEFKLFFGICLFLIIATAGHFFESGIAGIHFIFLLLINPKPKSPCLQNIQE